MNLDELLNAAARGIRDMPEQDFAVGLPRLRNEHHRRTRDDLARARHAAFLDSLDLEQAAYELAQSRDREGNLGEAARWYRIAAKHDHADAALRLGEVLDLLAHRCALQPGNETRHHELHLITEAAQAYAEAYAAGYTEAADRIDEMLDAFSRRQRPPEDAPEPAGPPEPECSFVRDFTPANGVLREDEIQGLSRHAAQCLPCMEAFVAFIRDAAGALPSGTVTDPFALQGAE